jgi:hypothetical protein
MLTSPALNKLQLTVEQHELKWPLFNIDIDLPSTEIELLNVHFELLIPKALGCASFRCSS